MKTPVFVVVGFLLWSLAFAKGKETVLSAEPAKVYPVMLEVIAGEWKLDQTSKENLTVSFRTGMSKFSWKGQDGSCLIIPIDGEEGSAPKKSKVMCNTEKRGSQAVTWGEGGKIQQKVLKLLTKALNQRGLIPAEEVVK